MLGETVGTQGVLYFGGFRGGIQGQRFNLSRYGMALSGTRRAITSERYEGANVVAKGGYYYLFASANACCNGSLSGYSVLAGRSTDPLGPYFDREGNSLRAARTGGTPVLNSTGNRWVGPGHNSVFRDFGGQWWTMYHAIDLSDPYFAGRPGYTRRPVLLDPLDWVNGWPSVRSGHGASTTQIPRPAAQSGQQSGYRPGSAPTDLMPGTAIVEASDELDGASLDPPWTWVREPDAATYRLTGTALELQTSGGDLSGESRGPVLTRPAPAGDYVLETALQARRAQHRQDVRPCASRLGRVRRRRPLRQPAARCARNDPRDRAQQEGASRRPATPQYGIMSGGPPGNLTGLRLVHRRSGGHDLYTAYTKQDGQRWIRGGTWVYDGLGSTARIGLVALGGAGFTATFEYLRTWTLS